MRKRQTETDEQGAKRKKTMQEFVSKQQQTETEEQAAMRKITNCDSMMRKRQTETEEQAAKRKKSKQDCMRRKREEMRQRSRNDSRDCNGEDMTNVIDFATKEAKHFLHRTWDPANPHKHRATVCIICDCFIIGNQTFIKLTKQDIAAHSEKLGVISYEEY